jgi:hypothetical protein
MLPEAFGQQPVDLARHFGGAIGEPPFRARRSRRFVRASDFTGSSSAAR